MTPTIIVIEEKTLIGMKLEMSLVENKTMELFQTFMPRKKELNDINGNIIFDLKEYPENYFTEFNPKTSFIKWAAVEVKSGETNPEGMETIQLYSGKYAKFVVEGSIHDNSPFEYIYGTWLPSSGFELDKRPHFDTMNTEEKDRQDIWIPIK